MNPYDHDALCPKCHFMPGTTDYHDGYHPDRGCPVNGALAGRIEDASLMLSWGWGSRDPEIDAKVSKIWADIAVERDAVPEHFDRACPNCKHRWAEAPA